MDGRGHADRQPAPAPAPARARPAVRWERLRTVARRAGVLGALSILSLVGAAGSSAGASALSLTLAGGDGTAVFEGRLYARAGAGISASVETTPDARCVVVFLNGSPVARETSDVARAAWTFALTGESGDGVRSVRATAFATPECEHTDGSATASFVLDNAAPVVHAKVEPPPNAAGWNDSSSVTVTWSAVDNGFSGVAVAPSPRKVVVTDETPGRSLAASAVDRVGNVGQGDVVVRIDRTPPQVAASRTPPPNGFGWNNSPVRVGFRCLDGLSGVAACSDPIDVSAEGATGEVPGAAFDVAGNAATVAAGPIALDLTPPRVVIRGVANGAVYAPGAVPPASCVAVDELSGPAGCTGRVRALGDGEGFAYAARASDRAGNVSERSVTYRVSKRAVALRATLLPPARRTATGARGRTSGSLRRHARASGGQARPTPMAASPAAARPRRGSCG